MIEGSQLDSFNLIVVYFQPLQLVEPGQSVRGQHAQLVVREIKEF